MKRNEPAPAPVVAGNFSVEFGQATVFFSTQSAPDGFEQKQKRTPANQLVYEDLNGGDAFYDEGDDVPDGYVASMENDPDKPKTRSFDFEHGTYTLVETDADGNDMRQLTGSLAEDLSPALIIAREKWLVKARDELLLLKANVVN